jgi:hypothetical protein
VENILSYFTVQAGSGKRATAPGIDLLVYSTWSSLAGQIRNGREIPMLKKVGYW